MVGSLFKETKIPNKNAENIGSGEMDNWLFETYKNSVMPHGNHSYQTESDMAMETICEYPPYQHTLSHWKRRCIFVPISQVLIYQSKNNIRTIPMGVAEQAFAGYHMR